MAPPFVADHRVGRTPVLPAAAYLEMCLAAAEELHGAGAKVEDLLVQRAMRFRGRGERVVRTIVTPADPGRWRARVRSRDLTDRASGEGWTLHAAASLSGTLPDTDGRPAEAWSPDALRARLPAELTRRDHYARQSRRGVHHGPSFRGVRRVWSAAGEALGWVDPPEEVLAEAAGYRIHPALLDACLQVIEACLPARLDGGAGAYVPIAVSRYRPRGPARGRLWSHIRLRYLPPSEAETITADVTLRGEDGRRVATVEGLCLKRAPHASPMPGATRDGEPARDAEGARRAEALAHVIGGSLA